MPTRWWLGKLWVTGDLGLHVLLYMQVLATCQIHSTPARWGGSCASECSQGLGNSAGEEGWVGYIHSCICYFCIIWGPIHLSCLLCDFPSLNNFFLYSLHRKSVDCKSSHFLPSFLKDSFTRYRIFGWRTFLFQHHEYVIPASSGSIVFRWCQSCILSLSTFT